MTLGKEFVRVIHVSVMKRTRLIMCGQVRLTWSLESRHYCKEAKETVDPSLVRW